MPLWLFTCAGRATWPGQGSALARLVTTGERVLTGENLLNGNLTALQGSLSSLFVFGISTPVRFVTSPKQMPKHRVAVRSHFVDGYG
jgi:hypothetical protein